MEIQKGTIILTTNHIYIFICMYAHIKAPSQDELMDALACSSKGSCLEKGLGDLDSEDLPCELLGFRV